MLTAVSWVGGAAGNWDVAANWSNDAIPTLAKFRRHDQYGEFLDDYNQIRRCGIGPQPYNRQHGLALDRWRFPHNRAGPEQQRGGFRRRRLQSDGRRQFQPEPAAQRCRCPEAARCPTPTNLATNSNFESPVAGNNTTMPSNWGAWGSSYLSTQYAFTGSQSLEMSGGNSGVEESFAATPGTSYTVSTDAMTPASDPLTGNEAGLCNCCSSTPRARCSVPTSPPIP